PKVGITPVDSLGGRDPSQSIYAVPILHVRLMYFALHTHKDLIAEVGKRVSQLESVDFAVGRLGPARYGIWSDGKLDGTFEHGGANVDGIGALMSEERDLPDAVRADAFLDLFPRAADHLRQSGIALQPADADVMRPHR